MKELGNSQLRLGEMEKAKAEALSERRALPMAFHRFEARVRMRSANAVSTFEVSRRALLDKNVRYVIIDNCTRKLTLDLSRFLLSVLKESPYWIRGSILQRETELHEARSSPNAYLMLDTFDDGDRISILRILGDLLSQFPDKRFVIVGNQLSDIEVPAYLGRREYISLDEIAADDSALLRFSRRLDPTYSKADIALGDITAEKFDSVLHYIRTKDFCEREWGYRERHSRGHGVTLLFHGPSGTGKTMAAEVLAHEVALPLYQVDLSSVMSKWVGETEKNLKAIFKAAQGVRGILLFDEGDAIFGQRAKIHSTQDRYGNLEVNFLLQEIESFSGIVVLSTNYEENLDPAFLRRFTYTLAFGHPDVERRFEIWKANIPKKLPLAASVDLAHLSRAWMTGGMIKNAIRDAAVQALSHGRDAIEGVDMWRAVKRELQKHGLELTEELVGWKMWLHVGAEWEQQYRGIKKEREKKKIEGKKEEKLLDSIVK